MADRAFIGTVYKEKQPDGSWHFHLFATHVDAVVTTPDKTFLSQSQLEFLQNLIGGGDTGDTAYSDLVEQVDENSDKIAIIEIDVANHTVSISNNTQAIAANAGAISNLQTQVNAINALVSADSDNIINTLTDIINFIEQANITEGMSLTYFISSMQLNLRVNGVKVNNTVQTNIYAPTSAGTADQILVSTGGTPVFKTIKTVVEKPTAPTPADYGKTAFQGGEIWLDTSGVIPDAPITIYNLKLVYDTTFNNPTDLFAFYHFTNKPENAPLFADGFAPLLYFETNEGLMAFGISKSGASGEVTLSPRLQKWNNSTNKYDLPYGDSMFQCTYIVDAGGDISNHYFYGGRDLIVPGGRLILSVEDKYTQLDINKPYTLTVVPS